MMMMVIMNLNDPATHRLFASIAEKYRWWHPRDHFKGTWDPTFYAAMPHERKRGHYVGHTHIVEEAIGGRKQHLMIEFQRVSKYFDVSSFRDNNITACMVARIYVDEPFIGPLAVGYLIHMVREKVTFTSDWIFNAAINYFYDPFSFVLMTLFSMEDRS